ncbi:MAG: hypothetical protein ABGX07_12245, partial [Pirellulaceae bacterium]
HVFSQMTNVNVPVCVRQRCGDQYPSVGHHFLVILPKRWRSGFVFVNRPIFFNPADAGDIKK